MNWTQLRRNIALGWGQGHFDEYWPWLQIRRRNPSKRGNQVSGDLPGYRRLSSFMGRVEWHFALLCLWLGAVDVREQFPIWPMPHRHPLATFPRRPRPGKLPDHRGLLEVARDAGIDHGWEVGHPDVPYVATVDIAVTRVVDGRLALGMIAGKPRESVDESSPDSRIIERLELQLRYSAEVSATFSIVDAAVIGEHFGANLEGFACAAFPKGRLSDKSLIADFAANISSVGARESINDAIREAATRFSLSDQDACILFRTGVWRRLIDLDMSQYIVMSYPLVSGAELVAQMEKELFKEIPL